MNGFLFSVASTANIGAGVAFTVIAVIFTFAVLLTAVWLLARFIGADKSENAVRYVVALVAAGVVLRFLTAFFYRRLQVRFCRLQPYDRAFFD